MTEEINALKKELDRFSKDTEFNNRSILNGDLERKGYALDTTNNNLVHGVEIIYVEDTIAEGEYEINIAADSTVTLTGLPPTATQTVSTSAGSTVR